jgi:hypothetical protein
VSVAGVSGDGGYETRRCGEAAPGSEGDREGGGEVEVVVGSLSVSFFGVAVVQIDCANEGTKK